MSSYLSMLCINRPSLNVAPCAYVGFCDATWCIWCDERHEYSHITPVLKSLHWLKIEQHIQYKLISLIYKILTTSQPTYLHNLISLQTDNNTRSSDVVTLARPSPASSLKVTDRSFQYASPQLWNQLPSSLREPVSPLYAYLNPSFSSPLSPSPLLSFTLNSKLTSLVNHFPHRSLTIDISDWLPRLMGPFSVFTVFVGVISCSWCGRQS